MFPTSEPAEIKGHKKPASPAQRVNTGQWLQRFDEEAFND
jgi:hypothetical protein